MVATLFLLGEIVGLDTACAQKPATAKPSPAQGFVGYFTPRPPYPPELIGRGVAEVGIVRVTCEADGHVSGVVIVATFGRKSVDEGTARYIKENWRSTTGKHAVFQLTMKYEANHAYIVPRGGR